MRLTYTLLQLGISHSIVLYSGFSFVKPNIITPILQLKMNSALLPICVTFLPIIIVTIYSFLHTRSSGFILFIPILPSTWKCLEINVTWILFFNLNLTLTFGELLIYLCAWFFPVEPKCSSPIQRKHVFMP